MLRHVAVISESLRATGGRTGSLGRTSFELKHGGRLALATIVGIVGATP